MKADALKKLVIAALDDMKGVDIASLHVSEITTITDYMIVVTGNSNRHVKSMADAVNMKSKEASVTVNGIEGQREAEWILIDLGDVIVHVMLSATRQLYDLEALWSLSLERDFSDAPEFNEN